MLNWSAMSKIPFIFFERAEGDLEKGEYSFINCRPRYMFHKLIDPNLNYSKMTIRISEIDTANLPKLIIEDDKLPDGRLEIPMYIEFWPSRVD